MSSDAFILPQWGGIAILNKAVHHLSLTDLDHTFATFRHQLLSLLGVPTLPPGVEYNRSQPFTDWQLDALVRLRTRQNVENSKETLKSIVALVDQIENMPVGQDVKGDVQDALSALDMVRLDCGSHLQRGLTSLRVSSGLRGRLFVPDVSITAFQPRTHLCLARILQPRDAGTALFPC